MMSLTEALNNICFFLKEPVRISLHAREWIDSNKEYKPLVCPMFYAYHLLEHAEII
jgi:hypothetical protein